MQALIFRLDKLWTEGCVQWRTDAEASVLFGVIKQTPAVKPVIIGVRTNKEYPDGFVRLITVGWQNAGER